MTLQVQALVDAKVMPWANGRGVTREFYRRDCADGSLMVRLSVADVVEPGAFSPLTGIDRTLVLIEGDGFDLDIEGRAVRVCPLLPVAFSGDDRVAATRVAGPSRDVNIMVKRGAARAAVSIQTGDCALDLRRGTFVFIADGAFSCPSTAAGPLPAGTLVSLPVSSTAAIPCVGNGSLIVIQISVVADEAMVWEDEPGSSS